MNIFCSVINFSHFRMFPIPMVLSVGPADPGSCACPRPNGYSLGPVPMVSVGPTGPGLGAIVGAGVMGGVVIGCVGGGVVLSLHSILSQND